MTYLDDDRLRDMASPEGIIEWYRGSRDPKVISPRGYYLYSNNLLDYYEETDEPVIRQRQRLKDGVRDGISFYSNQKGPHGVATIEKWFRDLAFHRRLIKQIPENRAEYIERHKRTIKCIRSARHCNSQRRAGISNQPFYVEPNTHFIPKEDIPKAERAGVTFVRAAGMMPSRLYWRLRHRFEKAGQIKGYWSTDHETDDNDSELTHFEFFFSDPEEEEKVTEELVWIKLRY